ncbi:MAG: hypothetical protein A2V88_16785 [Elusimicrobia bacterium RBG_16_66_12]|nr:MAG: hypothetical protein A2V88_16785 [Elusimicrobia bacterium RBG_16_66_12]
MPIAAAFLAVLSPAARAATYEIDAAHSQVAFRIRHLVGKVPGRFTAFSGAVSYEPGKPETWTVAARIDPASINTDNVKRDEHLRAPDFFDTAKCPEMAFKSVKVTDAKGAAAKLHGLLTMHCVTKPVVLDLELGGVGKDPWGGQRAGFTARTLLNRKDFGIVFNKVLDNGGLMLGEDVEVVIDIEAAAKAEAPAKK